MIRSPLPLSAKLLLTALAFGRMAGPLAPAANARFGNQVTTNQTKRPSPL